MPKQKSKRLDSIEIRITGKSGFGVSVSETACPERIDYVEGRSGEVARVKPGHEITVIRRDNVTRTTVGFSGTPEESGIRYSARNARTAIRERVNR